jgi:hypothetical protein
MIGSAIGSQEFIAHPQAGFGGWEAIKDPTNKSFILDTPRENSETRIHYLPVGKDPA